MEWGGYPFPSVKLMGLHTRRVSTNILCKRNFHRHVSDCACSQSLTDNWHAYFAEKPRLGCRNGSSRFSVCEMIMISNSSTRGILCRDCLSLLIREIRFHIGL